MAAKPPREPITLKSSDLSKMSKNERIKVESRGLFFVADGTGERHTFLDEVRELDDSTTPTISGTANELSKFFGIYRQQARRERGKKLDDHFFMVRIKLPAGGELSTGQWIALDGAAEEFADGTLRITSRQGIQYHHVYGPKLAPLVRHLNRRYRAGATLGGCGDVNRNTMTSPIDGLDPEFQPRGKELAFAVGDELAPHMKSSAANKAVRRRPDTGGRSSSHQPVNFCLMFMVGSPLEPACDYDWDALRMAARMRM